ncbi:hypothetical protein Sme01_25110 [Sphaerisporangium melleum]|uniref:Protein-glutamine gamma-glutamyltransferase-like C-terminal domain-containing protein n=1 Tax=Sphaerisporangium melleum TaxID=321316 RepID=A0A917VD91_9ACTN|nr:DUF4129 domain-containing protein [Sphaerisporangium melleum]GGK64783.1 hypothetical protein GCM10007964_04820 [Sphaerisporangium melleum]GII70035.1 hypothetical protein Sme01_25110 [Sphaerisporangium melleum]
MTVPAALVTAAALLAPGDGIGRDEARRRAVEELVKPEYQQESLLERAYRMLREFIDTLMDGAPGGVPGGVLALVLVLLLVAGLLVLIAWQARRATGVRRAAAEGLFGPRARTAEEHRAEAERMATESRWSDAIRERLRAVARDLEDRAIVTPQAGRTADELAGAAGRELPALAPALAAAARLFDDVTYGQVPGTAEGYGSLVDLDAAVRAARPAAAAAR